MKTVTEADFLSCYEVWYACWTKYIASEGCYFERDNVRLYE
jgi:hypothetical protein